MRAHLTLPREIARNVFWLGGCMRFDLGTQHLHTHNSCYLVVGSSAALLFDTGYPPNWPEISSALDAALDDRPLDYVVPSHPETPHAGNLGQLVAKYPEATVLGDVRDYHLYYPETTPRLRPAAAGTTIELGGNIAFTVLEATIRDLPNTVWGYESSNQIMFTSDGFIYAHHPASAEAGEAVHAAGECALLSNELTSLPTPERAAINTSSGLYWTHYHDADIVFNLLDEQLRRYPTRMFAPTHGNVISGDLQTITSIVRAGLRSAYRYPRESRNTTPSTRKAEATTTGTHDDLA